MKKTVFYITLILLWAIVYKIFVDILGVWKFYSFPSPQMVFYSLKNILINDNKLLIAIVSSLRRVVLGYIVALILGLSIGFFTTKTVTLRDELIGLFVGIQTLPNICWLPFAILWFGLNEKAIIAVVIIGAMFTISISTESGIRNINSIYIKAAKTMGFSGLKLYTKVILPAAFPEILSGMRQGWSFAWRGLIAGEMFVSAIGLGQMLMMGREMADINRVTALMLVIIIGVFVDKLVFGEIQNKVSKIWGN